MSEQDRRASEDMTARLMLVLLALGWGVSWPAMRIALSEIPPFSMRIGTLTLGVVTLWLMARTRRRSLAVGDARAWMHLVIASLFNIVAFSILTPFAQLYAATTRVAILVYTMPIWASLMARVVLGERFTPVRALALVLCVAGMAVLIAPLAAAGIPAGILLAIGAAVGWAAGTVYLKWAHIEADPVVLAGRGRPRRHQRVRAGLRGIASPLAGEYRAAARAFVRGPHRLGPRLFSLVRHRAAAARDDRGVRRAERAGGRRDRLRADPGRAADDCGHRRACSDPVGVRLRDIVAAGVAS